MEDYKLFLSLLGDKPKCLVCDGTDHLKRDCKQVCSICSKTGHKEGSCRKTYANAHKHSTDSNPLGSASLEVDANDLAEEENKAAITPQAVNASKKDTKSSTIPANGQQSLKLFDYFSHPETGKPPVESENSKRKNISNLDLSSSLNDSSSRISHENKKANLNSTGGASGTDINMPECAADKQNENLNSSSLTGDSNRPDNQLTIQSIANEFVKHI
jgi:hypothetical protein